MAARQILDILLLKNKLSMLKSKYFDHFFVYADIL